MSIYNEIYGVYYYMLEMILKKASEGPVTLGEINSIVSKYGFSESSIYFTPDATAKTGGYNLLREMDEGYISNLKQCPAEFTTSLQRGFIKSILEDKKMRLFLSDEMIEELGEAFKDTKPLFKAEDIMMTETALDSDDFTDEKYIGIFKTLLGAIKNRNAVRIVFDTSKGERKTIKLMPYKLEYGVRDDKFRICGVSIYHERAKGYVKINLGRIHTITTLHQSFNIDFDYYIDKKKIPEPIEIEVSNMRNGFERVFIGLSNYERISTYDEETGKSRIKIYYTNDDELELLILLLSFGPAVKVLGPEDFKEQFVERIKKQYEMMKKPRE